MTFGGPLRTGESITVAFDWGWHVPERSEGRGLVVYHALRCAQGRATQIRQLFFFGS